MGRPQKPDAHHFLVSARFTNAEHERLGHAAKLLKVSKSGFIREAINFVVHDDPSILKRIENSIETRRWGKLGKAET